MQQATLEQRERAAWQAFRRGDSCLAHLPYWATIEVTRNCNFRCVMCSRVRQPNAPENNMTPELFARVADKVFPHIRRLQFLGQGEATSSPYWQQILELCRPWSDRLEFHIVTNLGVRNDSMWRAMAELNFHFTVSCDGVDGETFERIRRGSRFDAWLENLELLSAARASVSGGDLRLAVTLQRWNYRQMPEFVTLAARYGASRVAFATVKGGQPLLGKLLSSAQLLFSGGVEGRSLARALASAPAAVKARWPGLLECLRRDTVSLDGVPNRELRALKEATLSRATETGVRVVFDDRRLAELGARSPCRRRPAPLPQDHREGIPVADNVSLYRKCFHPYYRISIDHKGVASDCCSPGDAGWPLLGDLKSQSFEEVWNSANYQAVRRKLWAGEPFNKACLWCFSNRVAS